MMIVLQEVSNQGAETVLHVTLPRPCIVCVQCTLVPNLQVITQSQYLKYLDIRSGAARIDLVEACLN